MTSRRDRHRVRALLGAGAAIVALAVAVSAFAAAATTKLRLGTATSSGLGRRVAITPHGRTLYVLSGETARHLLCRSAACLSIWPPLTVTSRATKLQLGAGLHGHLSILRRAGAALQVTLNGRPLYRYARDHGRGQARGEGIASFGGTWHAVAAAGPVTPTPKQTPAPSPQPYPYPTTGSAPSTTPAPAPPTTMTTTTPTPPPPPKYGY